MLLGQNPWHAACGTGCSPPLARRAGADRQRHPGRCSARGQRPDLIAAERTLAAETARVGKRWRRVFPSLSLSGSFGWQAYSFGALGGGDSLVRALGGTLAATLFDGGRLRRQVEVQNAVQEQALVAYESSVLTALEEIENGLEGSTCGRS